MKKLLPLAAALTFTLTACAAPASSAAVLTATEATELQAVGSGEVHILTPHRDGMYYQTFQQCEIDHTDQIGRILVYSIDEMTNTARPACNVPDCPHDSTACPAWCDTSAALFVDGDELYLLASVNEPENYHYALQKINAERTQQTTLVADLPHGFVPIDTLAADDENLY